MRARVVSLIAVGWGASAWFWSGAAGAQQADTNPPVPNVLILLDNSGSMERMIDGTIPESTPANACNCTDNGPNNKPTCVFPDTSNPSAASPVPNRWNTVQQAMTGYLAAQSGATSGFNCIAMPRTANSTFNTEYQIGGVGGPPYDLNYYLNFHRMVAEDTSAGTGPLATACVVGPGPVPGGTSSNGVGPSPYLYATGDATQYTNVPAATVDRPYGTTFGTTPTCNFTQLQNGAITTMTSLMRFGLMTFDSDPSAGTGVNPSSANSLTNPTFAGMWSYFPGWDTAGTPCNFSPWAPASNCSGNPVDCSTSSLLAVGARNGSAPPWEGRMVPLPTPSGLTQAQSNAEVAQVILASRPYGPTPTAGLFTAAEYYFQADPIGPITDPFVKPPSGLPCRKEYIILITDGAPNLDMRTACAAAGGDAGANGTCPFNLPETTAGVLYNGGVALANQQFVTTFVIGFATSSFTNDGGALVQCQQLVTNGTLAAACAPAAGQSADAGAPPADPTYAPCCELENIAAAGGSGHAYFADTAEALQSALGAILGSIGINATARTVPTFSPVLTAGNAQMYNSWLFPNPGAPWAGDIKRTTYTCPTAGGAPASMNLPNVNNGDDFAANLNLAASVAARTYFAMEPSLNGAGTHDASASIRPYASTTSAYDGLSFETSTTYTTTGGTLGTIGSNLTYDTLGVNPATSTGGNNSYPYTPVTALPGPQKYLTAAQTESMILDFIFGQAEPAGIPADFGWQSRCPSCGAGNVAALVPPSSFGDIYHATPTVVGAPEALLDDVTYSGFRTFVTTTSGGGGDAGTSSPRRPVVYAPTNDGLLHAFYADQTVAPEAPNESWSLLLPAAMPQLLSTYPATDQFLADGSPVVKDTVWDRTTITPSACGTGTTVTGPPGSGTCPWHTTLVAGYGKSQQGYYGVDVTNPVTPTFRWQLTKMPTGNFQIFGKHAATPTIATVALNIGSPPVVHEVGVAILPGGSDGAPTGGACERISTAVPPSNPDSEPASSYQARSYVNCWGSPAVYNSPVEGRSLSIVRLDTGEIVRVFARAADFNATDALVTGTNHVITNTQLDSPMTGTPIVYPADVGAVATKIFVGDSDGTLWRFDVSNPDPTKWFGDMFLDLYNTTVDPPASGGGATGNFADGQPFDVPIVTSLDTTGSLVLNIASGTTQSFDTTGIEYLYSVSEKPGGSPYKLRASVNWYWVPATPSVTTTPSQLQQGERVSGPMTVFDGTLYFATYYAGNPATGCNPGRAKLWGFDYITPLDPTHLGEGGVRLPALTCSATQDWTDPGNMCGTPQPAVVPGVAILATPACAAQATGTVAGVTHTALSNVAAGGFSLVANVAAEGSAPGTQVQMSLATPVSPTVIDSWASVIE
jgi:type IV pilus assembly protein PilY1